MTNRGNTREPVQTDELVRTGAARLMEAWHPRQAAPAAPRPEENAGGNAGTGTAVKAQTDGETLAEAENLAEAGIDARSDARTLLCAATGWALSALLAHPEREVAPEARACYWEAIRRRGLHEPVAYITGETGFFGRLFKVTPDVLIPRPDTEVLVELVLRLLPEKAAVRPIRILDVGTGSGCIPVTLLCERADVTAVAVDVSPEALTVAWENANRHGVTPRMNYLCWDILTPPPARLNAPFDVIVSNPPYIAAEDLKSLMTDVIGFEPTRALDGGPDGLLFYRRLLWLASKMLSKNGALVVEIGYNQREAVVSLFEQAGFAPRCFQDYESRDRVVIGSIVKNH